MRPRPFGFAAIAGKALIQLMQFMRVWHGNKDTRYGFTVARIAPQLAQNEEALIRQRSMLIYVLRHVEACGGVIFSGLRTKEVCCA
jgi:hypothetical protein